MTPLDLTQRPPRPFRAELDGIAYLPRAIDKTRAELPGGNLGAYLILSDEVVTMSAMFYRKMGITHEEFTAAVASAETDDDVAAWLRARIEAAQVVGWHARLFGIHLSDIPSPTRERVLERHPVGKTMPDSALLADVIDADDAEMFAGT
jgi:Domain of unknown function (DUF5069)